MFMTIEQATQHASVSRSTINRAIKSGKLSITTLTNGQRRIDPAELDRAFPPERGHEKIQHMIPLAPTHDTSSYQMSDDLIRSLRDQIEILKQNLEDAKAREKIHLDLLQTKLITDQRPNQPIEPPKETIEEQLLPVKISEKKGGKGKKSKGKKKKKK